LKRGLERAIESRFDRHSISGSAADCWKMPLAASGRHIPGITLNPAVLGYFEYQVHSRRTWCVEGIPPSLFRHLAAPSIPFQC
jgi:hypothetical protein